MLKLSRNNQNIQNVWGPPEHSAIGNVHRAIWLLGIITLQHVIQNNCRWGLMVFSDGMVHFLKIENSFSQIYQNYLVALTYISLGHIASKSVKVKLVFQRYMYVFM